MRLSRFFFSNLLLAHALVGVGMEKPWYGTTIPMVAEGWFGFTIGVFVCVGKEEVVVRLRWLII